ncbi:MAG: YdiU family protein [Verrucomicrobiota bacterium]
MIFPFDNTFARLPVGFFASVLPSPVESPEFLQLNRKLAEELGLDLDRLASDEGLAILSGNAAAEGAEPLAMAYSGHQFGGFSPQLGDGRAILLGEVVGRDGRRDIQLKGAGPTPFSRRGDGRSALGPVLREYILSEAMAALGVPTTRALAAIATGEKVYRTGMEPGGVFTRVAQSHLRIGTFQWFAARQDEENLRILADYAIERHYPDARDSSNPYRTLLERVMERQADLVAHWMQFGFIHGVMNTDNMTISGETIDYGPCAFLDEYHPAKKFSSIDQHGRYAFGNQPTIAQWNLTRFAETLLPLLDEDADKAVSEAETALERFPDLHQTALQLRFTSKIGLGTDHAEHWPLVERLLAEMKTAEADFTLTFRHLTEALETGCDDPVTNQFPEEDGILSWLGDWRGKIGEEGKREALKRMKAANPVYIARNHRVEEVIQAGYQGNFAPFHLLNEVLQHPFDSEEKFQDFENAPQPDEVVEATFCGT